MRSLLVLLALTGCSLASYEKPAVAKKHVVEKTVYKSAGYGGPAYSAKSPLIYHGKYGGKCGNDGFYYNNEYSFVICSNGNAYEQRCAPGSRNSGYDKYEYGKDYYYHDFCDVNLVDAGYAVQHGYGGGYGGGYGNDYDAAKAEYQHEHDRQEGYAVPEEHNSAGYKTSAKQAGGYSMSGKQDETYSVSGKQDSGYSIHHVARGGYRQSESYTKEGYGYRSGSMPGYD